MQKIDKIFSDPKAYPEPPKWLEYMITKERWRLMIYRLSDMYRNCLTLNFAIQVATLLLSGLLLTLTPSLPRE